MNGLAHLLGYCDVTEGFLKILVNKIKPCTLLIGIPECACSRVPPEVRESFPGGTRAT